MKVQVLLLFLSILRSLDGHVLFKRELSIANAPLLDATQKYIIKPVPTAESRNEVLERVPYDAVNFDDTNAASINKRPSPELSLPIVTANGEQKLVDSETNTNLNKIKEVAADRFKVLGEQESAGAFDATIKKDDSVDLLVGNQEPKVESVVKKEKENELKPFTVETDPKSVTSDTKIIKEDKVTETKPSTVETEPTSGTINTKTIKEDKVTEVESTTVETEPTSVSADVKPVKEDKVTETKPPTVETEPNSVTVDGKPFKEDKVTETKPSTVETEPTSVTADAKPKEDKVSEVNSGTVETVLKETTSDTKTTKDHLVVPQLYNQEKYKVTEVKPSIIETEPKSTPTLVLPVATAVEPVAQNVVPVNKGKESENEVIPKDSHISNEVLPTRVEESEVRPQIHTASIATVVDEKVSVTVDQKLEATEVQDKPISNEIPKEIKTEEASTAATAAVTEQPISNEIVPEPQKEKEVLAPATTVSVTTGNADQDQTNLVKDKPVSNEVVPVSQTPTDVSPQKLYTSPVLVATTNLQGPVFVSEPVSPSSGVVKDKVTPSTNTQKIETQVLNQKESQIADQNLNVKEPASQTSSLLTEKLETNPVKVNKKPVPVVTVAPLTASPVVSTDKAPPRVAEVATPVVNQKVPKPVVSKVPADFLSNYNTLKFPIEGGVITLEELLKAPKPPPILFDALLTTTKPKTEYTNVPKQPAYPVKPAAALPPVSIQKLSNDIVSSATVSSTLNEVAKPVEAQPAVVPPKPVSTKVTDKVNEEGSGSFENAVSPGEPSVPVPIVSDAKPSKVEGLVENASPQVASKPEPNASSPQVLDIKKESSNAESSSVTPTPVVAKPETPIQETPVTVSQVVTQTPVPSKIVGNKLSIPISLTLNLGGTENLGANPIITVLVENNSETAAPAPAATSTVTDVKPNAVETTVEEVKVTTVKPLDVTPELNSKPLTTQPDAIQSSKPVTTKPTGNKKPVTKKPNSNRPSRKPSKKPATLDQQTPNQVNNRVDAFTPDPFVVQTPTTNTSRPWFMNLFNNNLPSLFSNPLNFSLPSRNQSIFGIGFLMVPRNFSRPFQFLNNFGNRQQNQAQRQSESQQKSFSSDSLKQVYFLPTNLLNHTSFFLNHTSHLLNQTDLMYTKPYFSTHNLTALNFTNFVPYKHEGNLFKPINSSVYSPILNKTELIHWFFPTKYLMDVLIAKESTQGRQNSIAAEENGKDNDVVSSGHPVDNKLSWHLFSPEALQNIFNQKPETNDPTATNTEKDTNPAHSKSSNKGDKEKPNAVKNSNPNYFLGSDIPNPILQFAQTFLSIFNR